MVKPSEAHARTVTTRISSAIAPGMVTPRPAGRALARGPRASRVSSGSAASSSAPTISVGTSRPSVPSPANPAISSVTSGGPTAMPALPPSENHESAVALRAPATPVAVL